MLLRQAPTGPILKGTADGQILTWNAALQEWIAGAAPAAGTAIGVALVDVVVPADQTGATPFYFDVLAIPGFDPNFNQQVWASLQSEAFSGEGPIVALIGSCMSRGAGNATLSLLVNTALSPVTLPTNFFWIVGSP